jgi:hypothetical protein
MVNEDSLENSEDDGKDLAVERGIQRRMRSAGQAVGDSLDKLTGAGARRQSEEFTNAVTTSVLGIHRDLLALSDRVKQVEQTQSQEITAPSSIVSTMAVILSLIAIILSLVTLVVVL